VNVGQHSVVQGALISHAQAKNSIVGGLFQSAPGAAMKDDNWCFVPSLSGLDHFAQPTRHFRAGLLIVTSLRDLAL
jgi:hypothetical protein